MAWPLLAIVGLAILASATNETADVILPIAELPPNAQARRTSTQTLTKMAMATQMA